MVYLKMQTCYRCNERPTSVEHAPARGFFPVEHRSQLITVPSCKAHNSDTSTDDEYVRNAFATIYGGNEIAAGFISDKAKRSFERSPALLKVTFKTLIPVLIGDQPSTAFELDFTRVERTMHKIACALHFHHFSEPLGCKTITTIKQAVDDKITRNEAGPLFSMFEQQRLKWHGANPKVFKYQMAEMKGLPTTFHFEFYEGINVLVSPEIAVHPSKLSNPPKRSDFVTDQ